MVGVPFGSLLAVLALIWRLGWPGVAAGVVIVATLFLIAGVRLEMEKREAEKVELVFEAPPAQKWGTNPAWIQHIEVTNRGPASTFQARIHSHVYGGDDPHYGKGVVLAWEQPGEDRVELGRGDSARIRLAAFSPSDEARRFSFRFFVPPQSRHAHSTDQYIAGAEQMTAIGADLLFDLRVRDMERDVSRERRVRVKFADDARPATSLAAITDYALS